MIWGLALLGAALVLNTIAGSIYTRKQIKRAAADVQHEIASLTARRIQSYIERKIERLQDAAVAMTLYPLGGQEQKLLGLLLLKNDRSFIEFSILDERGVEIIKASERRVYTTADLQNQSALQPFVEIRAGNVYVGPVRTSEQAEPYVTLAVPLKSSPSKLIGVLVVETNLKFLWEVIAGSRFGKGGYAYLIDGDGKLLAHHDASLVLKGISLADLPKIQTFLESGSKDTMPSEETIGLNGKKVLSTYAPLPVMDWAVVVEEPVEFALSDLDQLHRYAVLLVGMGLLVGAGVMIWVSRKITQPIKELSEGARTICAGNLDHRTLIDTGDEIEELADEFNRMTESLQTSYATLEQNVQQRTQEVSALYDVTRTVNQSLELPSVLKDVVEKISQIFHFDTTRIFLYDSKRDNLILRSYCETRSGPWTSLEKIKRGRSIVGRVAESGKAAIFEDVQSNSLYTDWSESGVSREAGCNFFGVLPVKTQSTIYGALSFGCRDKQRLSDGELRLLSSMSEHVGLAVEKANLFEQVKTRSQHLAVLHNIGAAVSQSLDLEVVLREAVERTSQALGFDAAWIYQLQPKTGVLQVRAQSGLSEELIQKLAGRKRDVGISGRVITSGQRMVFNDAMDDETFRALTHDANTSPLGFRGGGVFPIRTKENIIGTLHVVNWAPRHLSPEELQLIESIAQEIGVAVENALLFGEVTAKTAELAKTNQELLEATHAKSEFIAAMSHELRTPLNIIIGNSDLARDGFFGDLNADQKSAMQKVSRNARVLLKMINDVLTLSRLEAKKMSLELSKVDVDEILEQARNHVEQINRDHHLEVRWEIDRNLPPLVTDPFKVEEILHNLISNAFKFTENGRIEVRVQNLQDRERMEFSVRDTGVGIETKDMGRIFNEFEQVKEVQSASNGGVGLGLSIVKKYLELLRGEIRIQSEPGHGSTFTFSIPHSIADYT